MTTAERQTTQTEWTTDGYLVQRADGKIVADTLKINGTTPQEALANARLIAAAPDLLAALERFVKKYDGIAGDTEVQARAAIAKATGNQP